ncbi:MAG TPA: glycosidase [bacterium]|nr:glycosidase [bacterium]
MRREIFERYGENPILTPEDWPYPVNAVFNPGAVEHNGEIYLLCRVETMEGLSHISIVKSSDCFKNWEIPGEPTLKPDPFHQEETWGVEDPRIVYLEDEKRYAITYVSFSKGGPLISLILTEDFKSFERIGPLVPPEDKDGSLFPKKFKGEYALIHRPIIRGEGHIWISFSPDLIHWGKHQILIPVRPGSWDCHRVGLGTQPLWTEEGWLIIYHGIRYTSAGALYRVGLALLDLENPTKLIARSKGWVFAPEEDYERIGNVTNVVFPSGAIYKKDSDLLVMYYGACDTSICVAYGKLKEIIELLKKGKI